MRILEKTFMTAAICCCWGLAVVAAVNDFIGKDDFFNPRINLQTPHIAWAKPYNQGALKVLFIVPRSGMREIVEIAQRLDMQYETFATESCSSFALEIPSGCDPGTHNAAQTKRLEELLEKDYDIIMMGGVDWKILPLESRYMILKKIKEGTGLIGYIPAPDEYMELVLKRNASVEEYSSFENNINGFPFELVPGFNKASSRKEFVAKNVKLFSFGKGRICVLQYPQGGIQDIKSKWHRSRPMHLFVPGCVGEILQADYTDYDFQLAFVIKAALWASKKETFLGLMPVPDIPTELIFAIDSKGKELISDCEFFILNQYGDNVYSINTKSRSDSENSSLLFKIPSLLTGKYRANLIVRDKDRKVIDFASASLIVRGKTSISKIVPDKKAFSLNKPVSGKILLDGVTPGAYVKLQIFDNWGRQIAQAEYPVNEGVVTFKVDHSRGLTVVNTITAELFDRENNPINLYKLKYTLSDIRSPVDEMRTLLWGDGKPDAFYFLPILKSWREKGIDTHYVWFSEWIPLANMRHIEIIDRINDVAADWCKQTKRDIPSGTRKPCLSEPEYLNKTVKKYSSIIEYLKNYSVSEFSMGDECHLTSGNNDVCFSPTCIKEFKEFIKKKYGTVENLNNAYDSAYKSFDEVEPMSLEEARQKNQISRWIDHKLHMNTEWTSIFELGRDTTQRFVPGGRIGYEGSNHPDVVIWNLGDYRQLARTMSFCGLYYRPFDAAAWRSFMDKSKLFSSAFFGGYGTPLVKKHHPDSQYMPWHNLFKGGNMYLLWMASTYGGSITAPDYSFYTYFNDAIERMSEIKQGLDKLLIRSNRVTDCGILYSPASIFTSAFFNSPVGKMSDFDNITQLIEDIGFQPRIYHSDEIEKGNLAINKPKFLFLACAHSLSETEISEIKKYVENGGVVIADIQPGIRNRSGNLYEKFPFSDLFGAKPGTTLDFKLNSGLTPDRALDIGGKFMPVWIDSQTKLEKGKFLARLSEIPAVIVNDYGKGKAVFLNFNIGDYISTRKAWANSPLRALLKRIIYNIAQTGPEVLVTPDISGMETTCFENGNILYVTLLQDMIGETDGTKYGTKEAPEIKEKTDIQIKLPRTGHIYNVRTGEYYGLTDKVNLPVQILDGVILASMPYKVDKVELAVPDPAPKAGTAFPYNVRIIPAGNTSPEEHIVQVNFFDPDGNAVEYYRKKLVVRGNAVDSVNLALNEKPGKWMLKAVDTVSKTEATHYFTVLPVSK